MPPGRVGESEDWPDGRLGFLRKLRSREFRFARVRQFGIDLEAAFPRPRIRRRPVVGSPLGRSGATGLRMTGLPIAT